MSNYFSKLEEAHPGVSGNKKNVIPADCIQAVNSYVFETFFGYNQNIDVPACPLNGTFQLGITCREDNEVASIPMLQLYVLTIVATLL